MRPVGGLEGARKGCVRTRALLTPLVLLAGLFLARAGGSGGAPQPCHALKFPANWDVRASAYADVTGDGTPECVLSVWRPWRDWPIARWAGRPTPITRNRDARGDSSHVAVLRPLPGGGYREVWVGSALFQPVTALAVLPGGTLATLETTYERGRDAPGVALSLWRWTGFGFGLLRREAVQARTLRLTPTGRLDLR